MVNGRVHTTLDTWLCSIGKLGDWSELHKNWPLFIFDVGGSGQRRIASTARSRGRQLMKILNPVFRSTAPQTPNSHAVILTFDI